MTQAQTNSIYQFKVNDINGETFDMSSLKGKKVLLVNVASKCGLTPQYEQLQELYDKYKESGFIIIGFPANNFANHMFTLANEVLSERGVAFDALRPLIAETAAKVLEMEPKKAQTGPAIRLDEKVINNHLELIKDDKIKEIYTILSESINRHSS